MSSNNKIPDKKERDRIEQDLDTTMLVEAAAGTGKTTCMVKRMVALLAENKCKIHEMAAVTFTRKSAAELRSRFQVALEDAVGLGSGNANLYLEDALSHIEQCFIGTIHSFCARILRERPVEARIDPGFQEADEIRDRSLRDRAWDDYAAALHVDNSALRKEFDRLGIEVQDLRAAFHTYANYPDVEEWPAPEVDPPDFDAVRALVEEVADHVDKIRSRFPDNHSDWVDLMRRYDRVRRMVRHNDPHDLSDLVTILKEFKKAAEKPYSQWKDGEREARDEAVVWKDFKERADVFLAQWQKHSYPVCMKALAGAREVYDKLREQEGVLNYQDLLMKAAVLLKDKPLIRRYFRKRFTRILVDEFQDTDPIQAQVMLFLTADDPHEPDWKNCRPVPGSLFVVGDPKQSIYRFRRADIVTYMAVKDIIQRRGAIIRLQTNFRSTASLIGWVNRTFQNKFPSTATPQAPVYVELKPDPNKDPREDPTPVRVLKVPEDLPTDKIPEYEAELIARTIKRAVEKKVTLPHTNRPAEPGDYLIITRRVRNLAMFGEKLQELGLEHEITGGDAVNQSRELALLHVCMRAVLQPDDSLALVAALRSELFGISDSALYHFKRAGGVFSYRAPIPEGLDQPDAEAFTDAFKRLRRYAEWTRTVPPVAAVEKIAADLGLAVGSCLEPGGNLRAGSLFKALELVRSALARDWSLTRIVDYLGRLSGQEEQHDGLPALPSKTPGVRVMNLHKVKGLEAPIVFLADATGDVPMRPTLHIDRSGATVKGYLLVQGRTFNNFAPVLASPADWEQIKPIESEFEKSERIRLNYVAATRAGAQVTITQRVTSRKGGNQYNPWKSFYEATGDAPLMPDPGRLDNAGRKPVPIEDTANPEAEARIAERWTAVKKHTYRVAGVKAIVAAEPAAPMLSTEHGTEWGSVIHGLLQAAMVDPQADLTTLSESLAAEHDLGPEAAELAVETVRSVMASEIWQRAMNSTQRLVEVPFQVMASPEGSPPTLLRGVIDLTFREPAGWVIVDYKTDRKALADLPPLVDQYGGQVRVYADSWAAITGEPVCEIGLYFTHTGMYVTLGQA